MRIPTWIMVLLAVTCAIPIILLVIVTRAVGLGSLIFALALGIPIFLYGRRRGQHAVEQNEQSWKQWEARHGARRSKANDT